MPYAWVPPVTAFEIHGLVINHVHKDDLAEMPVMDYWYEYNGIEFDVRELEVMTNGEVSDEDIIRAAIEAGLKPFTGAVKKQKLTVRRLTDAYVVHEVDIEAFTPEQAQEIAEDLPDPAWQAGGIIEFDHSITEVVDEDYNVLLESGK